MLRKALEVKPGFKRAMDMLDRLGASETVMADVAVPGLGLEGWQVVERASSFFATNERYPRIRVPLEMLADGKPRILGWELKEPPFKEIGILRFHVGVVPGPTGKPEEVEQAAIIDLRSQSVIAVQPDRQGDKKATWNWQDDGKVQVAAVDGVTDEFALRNIAPVAPLATRTKRRRRSNDYGAPDWAPWANDPWAGNQYKPRRKAKRRKRKPKSFFDLLFNN